MTKQEFKERCNQLSTSACVAMFREYCMEYGYLEGALHEFGEDFFDLYFSDKMEVCRATFFGEIHDWFDPYIRLNVYGNLETFTEDEALAIISDALDDIYEHPDIWKQYINEDEQIH